MPDGPETGTGSSNTGEQGQPAPTSTPPPPPPPEPKATYTDDQVNAMLARETEKARRVANKALADELGLPTVEDLKKFVADSKAAQAAQMTEAERKLAEAIEREAKAATAEATAAKVIHETAVTSALIEAGVPVGDAKLVVPMVNVEPGAATEDVVAAVTALKERLPNLFGQPAKPPASPSSEPSSGGSPATRSETMSALERGRLLAKERQGRTTP